MQKKETYVQTIYAETEVHMYVQLSISVFLVDIELFMNLSLPIFHMNSLIFYVTTHSKSIQLK